MWGSMRGGGMSEGEEGGEWGGGVHHHRPKPPPPKPSRIPTPPNSPRRNESFLSSCPTRVTTGRSPPQKAQTAPNHHHGTAYEGRPRPENHQPPQDRHRKPPPPTKTDTPKGAEKLYVELMQRTIDPCRPSKESLHGLYTSSGWMR